MYVEPTKGNYGTSAGSVHDYYYVPVGYDNLDNYIPYQDPTDQEGQRDYSYQQISSYNPNKYLQIESGSGSNEVEQLMLMVIIILVLFLILVSIGYYCYDIRGKKEMTQRSNEQKKEMSNLIDALCDQNLFEKALKEGKIAIGKPVLNKEVNDGLKESSLVPFKGRRVTQPN